MGLDTVVLQSFFSSDYRNPAMEMDTVEPVFDKAAYVQRCAECTEEAAEGIVSELEDAPVEALPVRLQCLSLIAERSGKKVHSRLHALARKVLKAQSLTRADRKAAVAVLDIVPLPVCSDDMKELLEALEEPQMHIVIPFLARFPRILSMVDRGQLPFAWAEVVLVRALYHSNGWIRAWAVEQSVEMDMRMIRENYEIVLGHVIPALSASDLLWRLIDKDKLESFYARLTAIFVKIAEDEGRREAVLSALSPKHSEMANESIAAPPSAPATGKKRRLLEEEELTMEDMKLMYLQLRATLDKQAAWNDRLEMEVSSLKAQLGALPPPTVVHNDETMGDSENPIVPPVSNTRPFPNQPLPKETTDPSPIPSDHDRSVVIARLPVDKSLSPLQQIHCDYDQVIALTELAGIPTLPVAIYRMPVGETNSSRMRLTKVVLPSKKHAQQLIKYASRVKRDKHFSEVYIRPSYENPEDRPKTPAAGRHANYRNPLTQRQSQPQNPRRVRTDSVFTNTRDIPNPPIPRYSSQQDEFHSDYKKADYSLINSQLANVDWSSAFSILKHVDEMYDLLMKLIQKSIDTHVPWIKVNITHGKVPPHIERLITLIRSLLACLSSLTCPCSIVLLVGCLHTAIPLTACLDEEDHGVMRECMVRIATISQLSLRIATFTKMLRVLARSYDKPSSLSSSLVFFGGLVRLLAPSHRFAVMDRMRAEFSPSFLEALLVRNAQLGEEKKKDDGEEDGFGVEEWYLLARSGRSSTQTAAAPSPSLRPFARLVAATAAGMGSEDGSDPAANLVGRLAKDFEAKETFPLLDSAAAALRHAGVATVEGVEEWMETGEPDSLLLVLAFLGRFLPSGGEKGGGVRGGFAEKHRLFEELPAISSSCDLTRKQKCVLREEAEVARLRMVTEEELMRHDPAELGSAALARVYEASLYEHKEALITLMARIIDCLPPAAEQGDGDLPARMLRAAEDVMNEEKKSAKYLPALTHLLALSTKLLQRGEAVEEVTDLYSRLIDAASLNTSIAVVLSRSLHDGIESIPDGVAKGGELCSILADLASFGPIPKKEIVVLHRCLRMVDEERKEEKGEGREEEEELRIHEATARARLYAILAALRLVDQRGEEAMVGLVGAIRTQIAEADKSSSKSFGLSLAHRKKTRAVALLLILSTRGIPKSISDTVFSSCVDWLLDPSQQFSIKLAVEWLVARLAQRDEQIRERLKGLDTKMADTRIGSVSSWVNILTLLARNADTPTRVSLLHLLLPWCTAQNFAVRCTAIAACRLIIARLTGAEPIYEMARAVGNFGGEPAGNSQKIVGNLMVDFYFATIDPERDLDLETVCCILTMRTGLPHDESIPVELMEAIVARAGGPLPIRVRCANDAALTAPSLVYNSTVFGELSIEYRISCLQKNQRCAPSFETDEGSGAGGEERGETDGTGDAPSGSAQKKIIPKEDGERERRREGKSIYVVASFIDKAANLGGLCRTSEIFTVDRLVVADAAIVNDATFKALSMSAESWQKIEEVRPDALPAWLAEMKRRGYALVAAEQASDSVPLHRYQFPEKTVLIMGDEKRGVPMAILRAVDAIVHIEQLGRVRSLNVHVTAALFIEKYAEQHLVE
ncbi:hypothetical protein PRIPAC_77858 [Pristionchus pacificus]|uniref:SpoU_methylase domain-containing protein n=1 Tax=Pristionchus pacificus TaxID=54126 RepID=A0A2A6BVM2_PRIPA|nr:hypothetical protein PRIPAC_77858 [Pristionchus pacificus]|eukprot:PDM69935.1 hypothetical protein PRIPAC_49147 [Pristionchus pacificus]